MCYRRVRILLLPFIGDRSVIHEQAGLLIDMSQLPSAFWSVSASEILQGLQATPQSLTGQEAQRRLTRANLLKPANHAILTTLGCRIVTGRSGGDSYRSGRCRCVGLTGVCQGEVEGCETGAWKYAGENTEDGLGSVACDDVNL